MARHGAENMGFAFAEALHAHVVDTFAESML